MIINDYLRQYLQAVTFHDYYTGSKCLYDLNAFFLGFKCHVIDMQEPKYTDSTAQGIQSSGDFFKTYCEHYSPLVLAKLGVFIKKELTNVIDEAEAN